MACPRCGQKKHWSLKKARPYFRCRVGHREWSQNALVETFWWNRNIAPLKIATILAYYASGKSLFLLQFFSRVLNSMLRK